MRARIVLALVALIALSLLVPAAKAQEQLLFRVNIPFEFIVSGVHMPPGTYLAFHETPTIIKFVRMDGKASAWVAVIPSPVSTNLVRNEIVFNEYGDTRFLAKIHTGHDQQVHKCFRCRMEENLSAQYGSKRMTTLALAVMDAK